MKKVRALVLSGCGINCEREMAYACEYVGATAEIIHLRQLLEMNLDHYEWLIFPGGFSFADELGAGKVLANRLRGFKEKLTRFVDQGKSILGICNGFQLLVKLGFFTPKISLARNASGRFQSQWADHHVCKSSSIYTKGLETLFLPLRHAEGRLIGETEDLNVVFQYAANPNGSTHEIAGVCDSSGRVLGMMAHPEAAIFPHHHPAWPRKDQARADGSLLLANAVNYLQGVV